MRGRLKDYSIRESRGKHSAEKYKCGHSVKKMLCVMAISPQSRHPWTPLTHMVSRSAWESAESRSHQPVNMTSSNWAWI